jgi:antitoxin StbD
LSAEYYEQLLARLEDLENAKLIRERGNGPFVEVTLDAL